MVKERGRISTQAHTTNFVNPFFENKSFSSKRRKCVRFLSKMNRRSFLQEFSTGCGKHSGKLNYTRFYAWKNAEKSRILSISQAKLWITLWKLWKTLCSFGAVENFFFGGCVSESQNFNGRIYRRFSQKRLLGGRYFGIRRTGKATN